MTEQFDENTIVLSFDVEWAGPIIVNDILVELDKRGLVGTFFCTHDGIEVPGHERALHPNFRRDGDSIRQLRKHFGGEFDELSDDNVIQQVLETTWKFCPEAVGLRTHSLYFELKLLAVMKQLGLVYDSSCMLPFQGHISPFSTMWGITEIPIYYMDHMDLVNGLTSFRVSDLALDQKGVKVFNFHPTLIYLNAESDEAYQNAKTDYADPAALRKRRYAGRGTRSLFLDLLDEIASGSFNAMTMAELSARWENSQGPD
jgi:hypothetical protein